MDQMVLMIMCVEKINRCIDNDNVKNPIVKDREIRENYRLIQ